MAYISSRAGRIGRPRLVDGIGMQFGPFGRHGPLLWPSVGSIARASCGDGVVLQNAVFGPTSAFCFVSASIVALYNSQQHKNTFFFVKSQDPLPWTMCPRVSYDMYSC
jgi:hypothetical protein